MMIDLANHSHAPLLLNTNSKKRKRYSGEDPEEEAKRFELNHRCLANPLIQQHYRFLLQEHYETLVPQRLQHKTFEKLSRDAKEILALAIASTARHLSFVKLDAADLPVFYNSQIGAELILIPGGNYTMGLSAALENEIIQSNVGSRMDLILFQSTVQRMRPTRTVHIQPFLLATKPITKPLPQSILMESEIRLPSEAEWEYAARGGGWNLLFPYHCHLLSSIATSMTQQSETEKNSFGLYGLGSVPEICADDWSDSLSGIPKDGSPRQNGTGKKVIRGDSLARGMHWSSKIIYQRRPQKSVLEATAVRLAMDILPKSNHYY